MTDNNNFENNNNGEYTPNFVMRDAEVEQPENEQVYEPVDVTTEFNQDDNQQGESYFKEPSQGEPSTGYFRDPRENFSNGTRSSASWSNGRCHSSYNSSNPKKKRTSPAVSLTRRGLAFLIAGCMCISVLFGCGGVYIGSKLFDDDSSSSSSSSTATSGYNLEDATGSNMTIQEVTSSTQDSVVEISTESVSSDSWMQQYVTEGAGSGVIISDDGYIITNNHVIESASKITVTTSDEKSYEAELIGTDSINDIAVIKIDASGLTAATYGNSDQLQVGDMAIAIGNPLGKLGGTVTAGIISATDRELSIDGKTMTLLQTDSSINPGNSGGGLFNGDGQLIGIVVAKSSGSDVEGLGFAIPINTAAEKAEQIMDQGYVSGQPYSGLVYTEGSSGIDQMFGGSSSGSVYIYSVESKTAKRAGFKAGDMVFAIDGTQISSIDDITSIINSHEVGDKVTYTIVRDGQTKEITLKIQEKTSTDASN